MLTVGQEAHGLLKSFLALLKDTFLLRKESCCIQLRVDGHLPCLVMATIPFPENTTEQWESKMLQAAPQPEHIRAVGKPQQACGGCKVLLY